jgi:hypothetical protein
MHHIPRALKIPWFERRFPSTTRDSDNVPVAHDMVNPKHIPADIWLHVAEFIPGDTLQNMAGVNSLFFDLAMDARYKEVSLKSICPATMRLLARLA